MKFNHCHSLLFVLLIVSTLFPSCELSIQGVQEEFPKFCILKFYDCADFYDNIYSCNYYNKLYFSAEHPIVPLHNGYYAIQYGVQALSSDLTFYEVGYNDFDSVFDSFGRNMDLFRSSIKGHLNPFAEWYESYGYGSTDTIIGHWIFGDCFGIDTAVINRVIDSGKMTDYFVKIK